MVYVCYFVEYIHDEDAGTYSEFRLLDQLGAFKTPNGAYNALYEWATDLFKKASIRGKEKEFQVIVDGREYCVGPLELHD